jgi:hypothetical protein
MVVEAEGPAPPAPAQAAQCSQPGMAWMADFVVWAEAVVPIAVANARNVIASKLFFSLFIFNSFYGIFVWEFRFVIFAALRWSRQVGEYRPIYSGSIKNSHLRQFGRTLRRNS